MPISLSQRVTLNQLADSCWDVVVIGAGVAGASFAIEAAQKNRSVLLVDAQRFPREKVCGGCLNPRAQMHLKQLGVFDRLLSAGAVVLDGINIQTAYRSVRWTTPQMLSIRRSTLDSILVERAIELGVTFMHGVRGRVIGIAGSRRIATREVQLDEGDLQRTIQANMVCVAAGLTRSAIAQDARWPKWVDPNSRIGASLVIQPETSPQLHASLLSRLVQRDARESTFQLHMLVGHAGYVGICLTDGHCIDIAAAIDPVHIKGQNGITLAVQSVLDECNLACSLASESLLWNTTSALTRNSSIAAKDGVFLLGDSVGYVEPFTGEGMSWAMSAAAQLAKLLDQFHGGDTGSMEQYWNAWINTHRSTQQSVARWVAKLARNRFPSKWILGFLDHAPPVRNVLFRKAMQ